MALTNDQIHIRKIWEAYKREVSPKKTRPQKIGFKGVSILVDLPKGVVDLFENPLEITSEEMKLLNVTFPDWYTVIKGVWVSAYTTQQGEMVFEKD